MYSEEKEEGNIDRQRIVVLDRGDYTSCTVNLHGATVTSWIVKNREMTFVSREAHFSGLSHIRGGIQFAFPFHGDSTFGPRNGFVRHLSWEVEGDPKKLENGDVTAHFFLRDNPFTHSVWNFKFKLHYIITLRERTLEFLMGVENPDPEFPMEFTVMQHCMLRVPNILKCEVLGFKDCLYRDYLQDKIVLREEREAVTITEHTDRIYYRPLSEVVVTNTVGGGAIKITSKSSKDVVLWNPWLEKSALMEDLGHDEYRQFVGLQSGIISSRIEINPLSCWFAYQIFEYLEPLTNTTTRQRPVDYLDLFDGYC